MKLAMIVAVMLIYIAGWLGASMALSDSCPRPPGAPARSLAFDIVTGAFWPLLYTHSRVYEQIAITPHFTVCEQP